MPVEDNNSSCCHDDVYNVFLQMDHSYQSFDKEMAAFTSGPSRLPESTTRGDQNVRQCTL